MGQTDVLIMAAGSGERFGGGEPKQFVLLHDRPMLTWTIDRFEANTVVDRITLVVTPGDEERVAKLVEGEGFKKVCGIVAGGETRQQSVLSGLEALDESSERVLVHDAARPCLSPALLERIFDALGDNAAVVPALAAVDTLVHVDDGHLDAILDRVNISSVQTPQAFRTELLLRVHRWADARGLTSNDEGSLVLAMGERVRTIPGERANIKITYEEDIRIAEAILSLQRQG
jgi:2-C-methyl-D-erythritol 4-phosphate cytidylyltransferase